MSVLINYFALLTIFIACLSLLGLSSFATKQRAKENEYSKGVRWLCKQSCFSTGKRLSQVSAPLSILTASLLAWYILNRWLENFAYRIYIERWVFLITGMLSVTIALVTVSFHSIKAALINSVKTL